MSLEWLDPFDPDYPFPPVETAFTDPDGLLAAGGDLNPKRLLHAYRRGIFPWYEDGQPILWWSPNPRAVLSAAFQDHTQPAQITAQQTLHGHL
jgi:leucyl/phenylalanyl-tRNA--protein transferase